MLLARGVALSRACLRPTNHNEGETRVSHVGSRLLSCAFHRFPFMNCESAYNNNFSGDNRLRRQNPLSVATSSRWLRAMKITVNFPKTEEEVLRHW